MDRLPPEIIERIVDCVIWMPEKKKDGHEAWEDGPLRLQHLWEHPLRHLVLKQSMTPDYRRRNPLTAAAQSMLALCRTSKAFLAICSRRVQECLILELFDSPVPALDIQGAPGTLVKAVSLDEALNTQHVLLHLPPGLLSMLSSCPSTVALVLGEPFFSLLADILDALPRPELLRELALWQPIQGPPADSFERSLQSIRRCTAIEWLRIDRSNPFGPTDAITGQDATRWLFGVLLQALQAPLTQLSLKMVYYAPPDELKDVAFPVGITRLRIDCSNLGDLILRLVEGCSKTLVYLYFNEVELDDDDDDMDAAPIHFHSLRFVHMHDIMETPSSLPTVVPRHWRFPAIRHLYLSYLHIIGRKAIKEFRENMEFMSDTLEYVYATGCWRSEGNTETEEWSAKLNRTLTEKGVEGLITLWHGY